MSDQQTPRYVAEGYDVFYCTTGDVVPSEDETNIIRDVCSTESHADATRIAAALNAQHEREMVGDDAERILAVHRACGGVTTDQLQPGCVREMREQIAAQAAEIKALRNTLRDFRDNYDCDSDAHRYGTHGHSCRCCVADNILTNTPAESEAE